MTATGTTTTTATTGTTGATDTMRTEFGKSLLTSSIALGLVATALVAAPVFAPVFAQDVGVSASIGHPGFFGRIDIGDAPRPRILYPKPVVVEVERERIPEPIYLRVRPGHAKYWREHCREYNACGERVYFVQDAWYTDAYAPYYRERHRHHDSE
jgi:hypothetical protein